MSVNFDSHGTSPLGERMRSALDAFRKSLTPSQKHIGTGQFQYPLGKAVEISGSVCIVLHTREFVGPDLMTLEGFIKLSADLSTIQTVKTAEWFGADTEVADINESGGVIFIGMSDSSSFGVQEVAIHTASTEYALHDHSSELGELANAFFLGANLCHLGLSSPGSGAIILIAQTNGTMLSRHRYDHTPDFDLACGASDGTHVYMVGKFTSNNHFVVVKVSVSTFEIVQAYSYTCPGGTSMTPRGPCTVVGGVLMFHVGRGATDQPLRIGLSASDISSVQWARSSRKQTVDVLIGVNDTATTYRATIGGQTEQATGNAAGANATASDLHAACAASAQSNFTARTWTVANNVVTGTTNNAGIILGSTTVSVVGGTGTISKVETENKYPFGILNGATRGFAIDGQNVVVCGKGLGTSINKYFAGKIRASDGAFLSAALSNESSGGNGFTHVAKLVYCVTQIMTYQPSPVPA